MAAPHHDAPDDRGRRQSRWTEPDPAAVAEKIETFVALTNRQFGSELAAFIAADEDKRDQVAAYAIRSPDLVRKARRLVPTILRDPDAYLPVVPGESKNAHSRRLAQFRSRADHEVQLLYRVQAGLVARRGHLLPEPNPRSRARRRLADEYPVRYLELVREEEQADADRAAQQAVERKKSRDAATDR
ncbi:hypothetical protein ABZ352_18590 [Streptomyces griseofuscus]|uniref:hypothetical protein n=1 Tax=Streptomyces griseofuscus TaxID=146922 RepID=UPI0033FB37DE